MATATTGNDGASLETSVLTATDTLWLTTVLAAEMMSTVLAAEMLSTDSGSLSLLLEEKSGVGEATETCNTERTAEAGVKAVGSADEGTAKATNESSLEAVAANESSLETVAANKTTADT